MKILAPDYYPEFKCIANKCRHTCCRGWEIDIDEKSLERFKKIPEIFEHVSLEGEPHIELLPEEKCPFLDGNGLCTIIDKYGEDMICDICRDHPRFRNFWSDRIEIGLGLVCEEAGRIILSRQTPMSLICLEDDGNEFDLPEDEQWLMDYRDQMLSKISEEGPMARLKEYLIYRHIPDALHDGKLEERSEFIEKAYNQIKTEWDKTDGTFDELIEIARQFSYDVEYNEL